MKCRVIQKNVHVSARKANLICNLIRNKSITQALVLLDNVEKKTASIIKKLLNSAIANATNNHQMRGEALYVYFITANQGTTIKRSLPRAKGSANMIRKRHSHLEIILSDDIKQKQKDLVESQYKVKKTKPKQIDKNIKTNIKENKLNETKKPEVVKLQTTPTKEGK
ncbi:MAG: 50S ribosomal protein L22 [Mycoplasmataceae bacterium]|jgi:ribosomal protein L22|nr:50S ribosomal protein L22 [Mycoplasmataceae bacterium]